MAKYAVAGLVVVARTGGFVVVRPVGWADGTGAARDGAAGGCSDVAAIDGGADEPTPAESRVALVDTALADTEV